VSRISRERAVLDFAGLGLGFFRRSGGFCAVLAGGRRVQARLACGCQKEKAARKNPGSFLG